jgi:hypothetical protein
LIRYREIMHLCAAPCGHMDGPMATDECLGANRSGAQNALIQNGDWCGLTPQPTENTRRRLTRNAAIKTTRPAIGRKTLAPIDQGGEMVTLSIDG